MKTAIVKDTEILTLLRTDRAVGFRMLFDAYYMPLCLFSVQMSDDFDASEDIVQSFFVRFWEEELHEKVDTSLRSYLFTSIRNNTLMHLRKQGRIDSLALSESQVDDDTLRSLLYEDSTEEELREREHQLYLALQQLSAGERQAIEKVVMDELSYKQASSEMGISINTLKTHLKRAMRKLRSANALLLLLGL